MAAWKSSPLPSTTGQLPWALGSVGGLVLELGQCTGMEPGANAPTAPGMLPPDPSELHEATQQPRLPEVTPASPGTQGVFLPLQGVPILHQTSAAQCLFEGWIKSPGSTHLQQLLPCSWLSVL